MKKTKNIDGLRFVNGQMYIPNPSKALGNKLTMMGVNANSPLRFVAREKQRKISVINDIELG